MGSSATFEETGLHANGATERISSETFQLLGGQRGILQRGMKHYTYSLSFCALEQMFLSPAWSTPASWNQVHRGSLLGSDCGKALPANRTLCEGLSHRRRTAEQLQQWVCKCAERRRWRKSRGLRLRSGDPQNVFSAKWIHGSLTQESKNGLFPVSTVWVALLPSASPFFQWHFHLVGRSLQSGSGWYLSSMKVGVRCSFNTFCFWANLWSCSSQIVPK